MNPSIDIYDITGVKLLSAIVSESAVSHEELMLSDYVQLEWNSDAGDVLPTGSYITYGGERYSLLEPYTPERLNEAEYRYAPQFQSRIMAWQKKPVPIYTYGSDGVTVEGREFDWEFTGSPADAMYMVQQAVKNETGETWNVEIADSLPATITVSSQSESIFSLLSAIADACETEWWADKGSNTIYLSFCQHGAAVSLATGVNIYAPNVTESKDGYYTRFYAFGSTRNITQDYDGGQAANSIVNKRLTLDPAKYPGGYKDVKGHFDGGVFVSDLKQGEVFPKVLYFDSVYPKSKLQVSGVRARLKYRLDNSTGDKVQTGVDAEGNPVYEQYAIWYFKIANFIFDPDTIIEGKNLSAHFESGQLAGRDFELHYYEDGKDVNDGADVSAFRIEAGDYEIILDETSGTTIPGLAYIIPQNGDDIVLYNIKMPQEYVDGAQEDLETELDKEIARRNGDNNSYEFDSYPTVFDTDGIDLSLGRSVSYNNGGDTLQTRVLMVEKHLDYPCQQRIRVGNERIKGTTQQLKEEVTNANQNIDLLKAFNDLSQSVTNAYANAQREMIEGFAAIKNIWRFDPDNPDTIYSEYNAYVKGSLSALGLSEGGGGGGSSYDLLQEWDKYVEADGKATALSAYLGKDLLDRLAVLEGSRRGHAIAVTGSGGVLTGVSESADGSTLTFTRGDVDLSAYATRQWVEAKGYATVAQLDGRIDDLVNGAPAAYDTLKEIADVLQGNVDSIGDIITALGTKADKARRITAGAGLTGGGDLSADRTLAVASANAGITVNADSIELNTVDDLATDDAARPLSAAQGKRIWDFVTDLFEKVTLSDGTSAIKARYGLYTDYFVSALGVSQGGSSGGGSAYERLDAWADYAQDKAGWVLSAALGHDLDTRVEALEGGSALAFTAQGQGKFVTAVTKAGNAVTVAKGDVAWGDVTGKPSSFTPSAHTHTVAQITDFPTSWAWGDVTGKPSVYPTDIAGISGLHSSWDALLKAAPSAYVTRWPTFAEVASKPTTLGGYGITDAYTKAEAEGRYVNVSGDTMTGRLTLPDALLSGKRIYFGDTSHYIELDAEGFHFSHGVYSEGFVSALGMSDGGGGGGTAYDLLQDWEDYSASSGGSTALSASLGHGLYEDVEALKGGSALTVVTTGGGNAVTSVEKQGTAVTVTKGATFLTGHQPIYALTLAAGKFAAATYDPKGGAKTVNVPTKTSHLANDSGFLTSHQTLYALTLQGNGSTLGTYTPNSAAKTVNITASAVGAYTKAEADGKYLPKASYTAADVLAKLKTVDGSGSGLDADTLDGWHGVGTSGNVLRKSGYVTSGTAGLSSYWAKVCSFTWNSQYNDQDICLYIHSAYNEKWGIVVIRARWQSATDAIVKLHILCGSISFKASDLRLYYDPSSSSGTLELWANIGGQYGVLNTYVLSETGRTTSEEGNVTLYSGSFSAAQTLPSKSYVSASFLKIGNTAANADTLDGVHLGGLLTSLSSSSGTNLSLTVGGVTKTVADLYAYRSKYTGLHWVARPKVGVYSKLCRIEKYGNVLLSVKLDQNSQASSHLYLISTGYDTANIVQLGANLYGSNSAAKIRLTQQGHSSFDVEILNDYGYNGATSTAVECNVIRCDNFCNITTYTTHTEGGGTVKKEITSSARYIVADLQGSVQGNASTATKLQTARTLWGRSFDGSANVSGDMTGVGNVTMSGKLHVEGNAYVNGTLKIGGGTLSWDSANSMFKLSHGVYSMGGVTALGLGGTGSSGGGTAYERLDAWADYAQDKAGWVLSAALGHDLDARVSAAEGTLEALRAAAEGVQSVGVMTIDEIDIAETTGEVSGIRPFMPYILGQKPMVYIVTDKPLTEAVGTVHVIGVLQITSDDQGHAVHETFTTSMTLNADGEFYGHSDLEVNVYRRSVDFHTSATGYKWTPWKPLAEDYELPQATSSALGGVKVGFAESGKNYPVELNSSGQMFVNVPWTDTTYGNATSSAAGLMSKGDKYTVDWLSNSGHVGDVTATLGADKVTLGFTTPNGAKITLPLPAASTGGAGVLKKLSGSTSQFLRGDGSWATPPNTTYGVATTSSNGLMSAADKEKLDDLFTKENTNYYTNFINKSYLTDGETVKCYNLGLVDPDGYVRLVQVVIEASSLKTYRVVADNNDDNVVTHAISFGVAVGLYIASFTIAINTRYHAANRGHYYYIKPVS